MGRRGTKLPTAYCLLPTRRDSAWVFNLGAEVYGWFTAQPVWRASCARLAARLPAGDRILGTLARDTDAVVVVNTLPDMALSPIFTPEERQLVGALSPAYSDVLVRNSR